MTLGEKALEASYPPLSREAFIKAEARALLERQRKEAADAETNGPAVHKFVPKAGSNECQECGKSYAEGNHTPLKKPAGGNAG